MSNSFSFKPKQKKQEQTNLNANHFLNIRAIDNNFLYTIDGNVLGYLKIYPENCKLMTRSEQMGHALRLVSNFSSEVKPFKIFFTNRPVDLTKNQNYQTYLMEKETNSQKFALLNQRSNAFGLLSTTGRALENEIFLIMWEQNDEYVEEELLKRLETMKQRLSNSGYRTEILEKDKIIQLIQAYLLPDVAYTEDKYYINPVSTTDF